MSSDVAEAILLSQMFGGGSGGLFGGQGLLYVAYLVCLFAVIIFKPERIRNLTMYRRACWMFAISLLLPTLITLGMGALLAGVSLPMAGPGRSGISGGMAALSPMLSNASALTQWALRILNSFGPILFAISVLCALISLVPSFIPPPDFELMGDEPPNPGPGRFRQLRPSAEPLFEKEPDHGPPKM